MKKSEAIVIVFIVFIFGIGLGIYAKTIDHDNDLMTIKCGEKGDLGIKLLEYTHDAKSENLFKDVSEYCQILKRNHEEDENIPGAWIKSIRSVDDSGIRIESWGAGDFFKSRGLSPFKHEKETN